MVLAPAGRWSGVGQELAVGEDRIALERLGYGVSGAEDGS